MSAPYTCKYCCLVEYDSQLKLGGHLSHCIKRKEKIAMDSFDLTLANNIANEIIFENSGNTDQFLSNRDDELPVDNDEMTYDIGELTSPSFIEAYKLASNAYLLRQKELFNHDDLENLQAGFTKNLSGLRKQADIRIYLEICEFVSNCHGLSIKECDELLELIRRVSFINGTEIPLPQKYSTIHDKILKSVNEKSTRIVKTYYNHCEDLFGKDNDLGKIPAVVTDILDLISSMLVDPAIYPYLKFDYEESILYKYEQVRGKRQRTEDIVYGEFYNSEFFRKAELEIREQWGNGCKIVPVFFGIDATNLNQAGSICATPVYLSLGNMSIDMLRSHLGIELCGYMPVSLASKAKLRSALQANGINYETNHDECIKIHSRWLEQECLNDFCVPIRW